MSKSDIIFAVLIAVPIIGGALIALRIGKKGASVPKTGGQIDDTQIPTDNERGTSLDKQKKPTAM